MKNVFYLFLLLMYGCTTQVQPELKMAVDEKIAVQRSVEVRCEASRDPFCAIQSPLIYLGSIDALRNQHHAALLDIGEDSLKARSAPDQGGYTKHTISELPVPQGSDRWPDHA